MEKQISTALVSAFPFSRSHPPFNRNTKEKRKTIFADSQKNARLKQTPSEGSMHYLWLCAVCYPPLDEQVFLFREMLLTDTLNPNPSFLH